MGIQHESTAPYSPQSNGKVECLNRTLKTFTCAMLYQANLPKSFWAEAIATVAYLINRLPSEAIREMASKATLSLQSMSSETF